MPIVFQNIYLYPYPMQSNTLKVTYRQAVFVTLVWMVVVIASLAWGAYGHRREALNIAYQNAITAITKDIAFRDWVASHGGVYVPPTEQTPPNPYLHFIPDRDVVTTTGKKLTLMNPAYVLREAQSLYQGEHGESAHITSLKPINPNNAPDEWEKMALNRFELGEREVKEVTQSAGVPQMRVMRAFVVDEVCLKCHAHQDYKIGDIRGGISATIPLKPLFDIEARDIRDLSISHGIIWLLGMAGIGAYNLVRKREIERIARQQELEHLASTDALTGLANRHTLVIRAEQELARAKRYGSELSLLMVDIDFFKKVNDTYGHQAGDIVLKKLADIFPLVLRDTDFAARFGGEEFVILLPETNAENALKAAERLRAWVNDTPVPLQQGEMVKFTISVGVASYSTSVNNSIEKLISGADKALYAAKETGRNKVCMDGYSADSSTMPL